jgi:hypothetical protein
MKTTIHLKHVKRSSLVPSDVAEPYKAEWADMFGKGDSNFIVTVIVGVVWHSRTYEFVTTEIIKYILNMILSQIRLLV